MGVLSIDVWLQRASQDSGSYCRPVASVNSGARWNRSHGCLQPSTHGEGGLPVRTRRVVMDDFAMLGRGRLVTDRGRCSLRTTCPVLQVVLLVGPDAGERRAYACSLRNCVQVGPIRRGAGPRPPRRSTVAMVVAELSTPSFRSSPLILR